MTQKWTEMRNLKKSLYPTWWKLFWISFCMTEIYFKVSQLNVGFLETPAAKTETVTNHKKTIFPKGIKNWYYRRSVFSKVSLFFLFEKFNVFRSVVNCFCALFSLMILPIPQFFCCSDKRQRNHQEWYSQCIIRCSLRLPAEEKSFRESFTLLVGYC